MFNLKEFITKNIVNGIKNGTFSKEYGNIMAVDYLVKGILTEDDVAGIDAEITEWIAEQAARVVEKISPEEVTESPDKVIEESMGDTGEERSEDENKPETDLKPPESDNTETESEVTEAAE